jgi:hypothetical protein
MSSYGLLANLAEARGLDLAAGSIETVLCSAEPLSDADLGCFRDRHSSMRKSGTPDLRGVPRRMRPRHPGRHPSRLAFARASG